MNICEYCSKEHDGTFGSGRFCCKSCANTYSSLIKREEKNKKITKTLSNSGHGDVTKKCEYCGNDFTVSYNKRKQKTCSVKCRGSLKSELTDDWQEKLSIKQKENYVNLGKNSKIKGNKAEAIVMAEFIKHDIPVLQPFGDNERYDLVVEINNTFKTIQVKYGRFHNGCIVADIRHKRNLKNKEYTTYYNKVDYIAVWSEYNNKIYLIKLLEYGDKNSISIRLDPPRNNSCYNTILWASDYEFNKIINLYL